MLVFRKSQGNQVLKKKDIILFAGILVLCGIAALVIFVFRSEEGNYAQITVDGEVYGRYDLSVDQTIEIDTDYGHNVVEIKDGCAVMTQADCPDGYCMDQGAVSNNKQTIVCLPHKVVVEVVITDEEESYYDIDGIAN